MGSGGLTILARHLMKGYPSTELVRGSWLDYLLLHGTGLS
jgi:hypothetical protein